MLNLINGSSLKVGQMFSVNIFRHEINRIGCIQIANCKKLCYFTFALIDNDFEIFGNEIIHEVSSP